MFPIDPGADATIGGMAATRASGTTAVRYGTMRENVLGLTVVLADGRVIQHRRPRAQVVVRLRPHAAVRRLRRHARRDHRGHAAAVRTARGGVARRCVRSRRWTARPTTVITTIQLGIPVARIEIIDEQQLDLVNRYSKTNYPLAPTLFFEFHGISQASVDEQARAVQEIAAEHGALGFQWASTPEERATLWQARHNVLYATIASRPGAKPWTTDVCVPISRLSECILETQDDLRRSHIRRAAGRPCRRRQLPSDLHGRSRRRRGDGRGQGRQRASGRARAATSAAPAPASTASASAS